VRRLCERWARLVRLENWVVGPAPARLLSNWVRCIEIHQVPWGHSSQQLMAAAAMHLKELTVRKKALQVGIACVRLVQMHARGRFWQRETNKAVFTCRTPRLHSKTWSPPRSMPTCSKVSKRKRTKDDRWSPIENPGKKFKSLESKV